MSQHDRRKAESQTPSGQFNGEEIEFAPFMFDASSQPEDNPTSNIGFADTSHLGIGDTSQLGAVDMEFEPFMFNQGEALGTLDPAKKGSGPLSQTMAQPVPVQSVQADSPAEPVQAASIESPSSTPSLPSLPEISGGQTADDTSAPAPFAGHEVPVPSYFMPVTTSDAAPEPSLTVAESAPLPDWFAGNAPSTGPITEDVPLPQEAQQVAEPRTPTEPLPATGPLANQPGLASAPASAPAPAMFSGMAGRTRGNTGPLSANMPNGSWSDNSLASIEDFSSVLIAMQAGKRLRQSGPISDALLSPATTPGATGSATSAVAETETPSASAFGSETSTSKSAAPSEAGGKSSGSTFPDWASQAASGMAGSSVHATQTERTSQATPGGTPAWPAQPWEISISTAIKLGPHMVRSRSASNCYA